MAKIKFKKNHFYYIKFLIEGKEHELLVRIKGMYHLFGKDSAYRIKVIACHSPLLGDLAGYGFRSIWQKSDGLPVFAVDYIVEWREIKLKEFPLYMRFPQIYPAFEELLNG
jgi:hypothetical protein